MAEKKKPYLTPVGVASYNYITTPDVGREYSDGKYKVKLVLDKSDPAAQEFVTKLQDAFIAEFDEESFKGNNRNFPVRTDEENEEQWFVIAKSGYPPKVWDTKGNPVHFQEGQYVGRGSEIAIGGTMNFGKYSGKDTLNLYLNDVQLVSLEEGGSNGSPFADRNDGYEAEASPFNGGGGDAEPKGGGNFDF